MTRKQSQEQILAAAEKKVNVPAIIGLVVGIIIAIPIVTLAPDIPSVIGGLIGGVVIYPLAYKIMNRTKTSTVHEKPIDDNIKVGYPNVDNMEKIDSEISDTLEKINESPATARGTATTADVPITSSKNPIETGGSS
jgi:hypothetical protein